MTDQVVIPLVSLLLFCNVYFLEGVGILSTHASIYRTHYIDIMRQPRANISSPTSQYDRAEFQKCEWRPVLSCRCICLKLYSCTPIVFPRICRQLEITCDRVKPLQSTTSKHVTSQMQRLPTTSNHFNPLQARYLQQ